MGREGDGIVARGVAGEDARVEVEHTISSAWTVGVVEVGEEGFKFHCSGRFELSGPPGRDDDNWKVAKRWILQSVVVGEV